MLTKLYKAIPVFTTAGYLYMIIKFAKTVIFENRRYMDSELSLLWLILLFIPIALAAGLYEEPTKKSNLLLRTFKLYLAYGLIIASVATYSHVLDTQFFENPYSLSLTQY